MTSNKRARYDDDVVQDGELTSAAEGFFEALGMIEASFEFSQLTKFLKSRGWSYALFRQSVRLPNWFNELNIW